MAGAQAKGAAANQGGGDKPNIILCMGDDHGWDETGYNGHPHLHTPVLDEMAASGIRFDCFYAAHPSCSPTRGSIMTGRHPNRYGTFSPNFSIRPEEISIAQILSDAGYACGHFGKWHLGPVKADSPTNPGAMGFHEWLSHDNFFELNPYLSRNGGPPQQFHGESSEILIEEATRFINKAKKNGQPFFVVVWFGSPHEPYSGLEKDLALYEDLPDRYQQQQVRLTSNETGRPTKRPLDQVLQERYAEITAMDRSMGILRQFLAKDNLRRNTLIWYCGDNGTPSGGIFTSPFRGQKGTMYEGGIRVPGIIEWPERITKPRISKINAVTSDILPTLCELAGSPVPDRPLDGISLKPLIDGEMKKRPRPICFWSFHFNREANHTPYIDPKLQEGTTPLVKMMAGRYTRNFRNFQHKEIREQDYQGTRVILDNQYKLILEGPRDGEKKKELFDLHSDPAEENNLVE
ncbi:sulfatase-like hydrolase/transferase, partial [bacterium]|nr:sulfatase-like hydrolase/transferase [bacterium]